MMVDEKKELEFLAIVGKENEQYLDLLKKLGYNFRLYNAHRDILFAAYEREFDEKSLSRAPVPTSVKLAVDNIKDVLSLVGASISLERGLQTVYLTYKWNSNLGRSILYDVRAVTSFDIFAEVPNISTSISFNVSSESDDPVKVIYVGAKVNCAIKIGPLEKRRGKDVVKEFLFEVARVLKPLAKKFPDARVYVIMSGRGKSGEESKYLGTAKELFLSK